RAAGHQCPRGEVPPRRGVQEAGSREQDGRRGRVPENARNTSARAGLMDVPLYMRVLWRFRVLVAAGLVLAVALALVSFYRVSLNGTLQLTPRGKEKWTSFARIFVTQQGFEWGSSIIGSNQKSNDSTKIGAQVSEEGRLASLASLYSSFALSDPVRRIMLRGGPVRGKLDAAPLPATENNPYALLPLISIS